MSGHKKKADKKVVILGDSGVGKTSLIRRYIEGTYSEGMSNTIGAAFFLKQWNGYNIALQTFTAAVQMLLFYVMIFMTRHRSKHWMVDTRVF